MLNYYKKYEKMSRQEALKYFGEVLVDLVEAENCEPTNRCTDGTNDTGFIEFNASVTIERKYFGALRLSIYYLVDKDDYEKVESLESLDWMRYISHYTAEEV